MSKTLKEIHEDEGKKPFKATPTEGSDEGEEFQFIEPNGNGFYGVKTGDPFELPIRRNGNERKWKSTRTRRNK